MTDQTEALELTTTERIIATRTTISTLPTMAEALSSPDAYALAQRRWGDIIKSGWIPAAIKTPMQCMAIVKHGESVGLDAWESLRALQLVQGNPCLKASALGGLLRKRYGPDCYTVLRSDDEACEIKVKVKDPETGEFIYPIVSFTSADVKRAGLGNLHNKFPASMKFARAITRVERRYLPLTSGEIWITELVEPKAAPTTLGEV